MRADGRGALPLLSPAPRLALDRAEFSRALAGQPAVSVPFTGDDGRRYLAAYARVPEPTGDDALGEPPGMPVLLAMEAPAAALDATDTVARRIVLLVSLAVLSVLALSVVVARTITRPLLRLSRSAEALGRGDLKHPLSLPRGDDEVARLGRALEAMRHALDDRDAERQMMLAGIAHEVRNPLGGMELFSGLLEEALVELPPSTSEPARAELLHHARRVRKELQYLTGVVNDFLAFARDTPLQREDVDVGALLEDVTSLCARAGSAALVRDDAFRGAFPLDRGRIKQALLNLVENALAATPPDGTITVRAKRGAQGGLVLEVEDRGRGMDAGTLASAFTPFYTTKEKGSGLGLPLVRKLARDHGGDACLASTPGRGTTVTLTLEPDERPLA